MERADAVGSALHAIIHYMSTKDESARRLKTLERVLSKAGIGSRTEARRWIGEGRVKLNGRILRDPDHWVDMDRDKVTFDGKPVRPSDRIYLLLFKPKGYITTYKDPDKRPTVYDLIQDRKEFLVPVGRLDLDTSGLLLLTNDTQFAERLTNPNYHVPKTYLVKAATLLTDAQLDNLRAGPTLDDGPTRPAQVTRLRDAGRHTFLELTITEGRNRQVRRMLEAIDSRVLKLVRTAIGPLQIAGLESGKHRLLQPDEVARLQQAARSRLV